MLALPHISSSPRAIDIDPKWVLEDPLKEQVLQGVEDGAGEEGISVATRETLLVLGKLVQKGGPQFHDEVDHPGVLGYFLDLGCYSVISTLEHQPQALQIYCNDL